MRAPRLRRILALFACSSASLAGGDVARAEVVDPTFPRAIVVGPPRGAAPSERLDPGRTGRSRTRLPSVPAEIWRRHVSGSIDFPPLVDASGNIIIALTIPEIVKLGPDAKELWRARLGNAAPLAPPTLLSDGTIAVVTAAGIAWGLTPSGTVRFSTPLGIGRRDADTAPLALDDGGLLVAAGSALVELDADGVIRGRTSLEEHGTDRATGAVIAGPGHEGGALITTAAGHVYRFRSPSPPRRLGSFGGTTARGAMLIDDRTLVAIVDGKRLVSLDLASGITHVRASGVPLDGLPALGDMSAYGDKSGPLLFVTTQLGLLVGIDPSGNERVHVALEKTAPVLVAGPTLAPAVETKPSPPVIVDAHGRVAFVRRGGTSRAGVVLPSGRVELAGDALSTCVTPIGILPAGDKRMLVACHEGSLWMYGE